MALLVPIHRDVEQIGALVLGDKAAGMPYSEEDLMIVDGFVDQLADVIHASKLQEVDAQAIQDMVARFGERERALHWQMWRMLAEREEEGQPLLDGVAAGEFASLVEDALRHIHDDAYLGDHTLARLGLVRWSLEGEDGGFLTGIARGKKLGQIMLQALNKLRPPGVEPKSHGEAQREWYPFIILRDAYVLGDLNRDIMSRLRISEGTFNRTRRRALLGVAEALYEMESEAQQTDPLR
jgi:hypothetical protein